MELFLVRTILNGKGCKEELFFFFRSFFFSLFCSFPPSALQLSHRVQDSATTFQSRPGPHFTLTVYADHCEELRESKEEQGWQSIQTAQFISITE